MKKKYTKIASLLISLATISAIGAGVTYAVFAKTDIADQEVSPTQGKAKKSIFLDCEEKWNLGYGEIFYAYFYKGGVTNFFVPSTIASITFSGDETGTRNVMVYEFDTLVYDTIIFVRCNPDGLTDNNVWDKKWNQTADISYSSSVNYYKITNINGAYSYGSIDESGEVDLAS